MVHIPRENRLLGALELGIIVKTLLWQRSEVLGLATSHLDLIDGLAWMDGRMDEGFLQQRMILPALSRQDIYCN